MVKQVVRLFTLMGLVFLSVSCGKKNAGEAFDYGTVTGTTYSNSFFGFTVSLPADWYVMDRAEIDRVQQLGAEAIPNRSLKKELTKAMDVQNAILLMVQGYEPGMGEGFNPNFQIVSENLSRYPNIKTGEQYLQQALKTLGMTGMSYATLDVPIGRTDIGGRVFHKIALEVMLGEGSLTQEMYAVVRDGFALAAVLNYVDEEQRAVLYSMLGTLRFDERRAK